MIEGDDGAPEPLRPRRASRRDTKRAGVSRTWRRSSGRCVVPLPGKHAEFAGRRYAQLDHQLRAVRFDGAQTDTELIGDLLVEFARDDAVEDVMFARRQHLQSRTL